MPLPAEIHGLKNGQSVGSAILTEKQWDSLVMQFGLSLREFQIAQCIFDDKKKQCIAQQLNISPHTVQSYIVRLYSKLCVKSRNELVLRILSLKMDSEDIPAFK